MTPYRSTIALLFTLLLYGLLPGMARSQPGTVSPETKPKTIRVFLDCNRCDERYIRTELPYLDYVRNKEDADVHLIISRQRTGSGGTEFTLRFLGRDRYDGQDRKTTFVSSQSDTDDEERQGLVRSITVGLLPYLRDTRVIENLDISYNAGDDGDTEAREDAWNYWVFELEGDLYFEGEESRNSMFLSGGASADRVTEVWKLQFFYNYDYNRRSFTNTDSLGNSTTDVFVTRGFYSRSEAVKSLTPHWSAGLMGEAFSSTRRNYHFGFNITPAVEYNIFPYAEYAQREFSFLYSVGPTWYNYDEITIFGKEQELLWRQELRVNLSVIQPWGEIEGRLHASTFLHDMSKNEVRFNLETDIRIFRGLSVSFRGRYAIINNQLSIPAGDISDAEQLLNLRAQSTSYSFGGSVGLEFSFGSIYNSVVNPRF